MVVDIISDSEGLVIFKRYQKNEDPSDSERVGCTSFPPVCLLRPMEPLSKRRLGQRFRYYPSIVRGEHPAAEKDGRTNRYTCKNRSFQSCTLLVLMALYRSSFVISCLT